MKAAALIAVFGIIAAAQIPDATRKRLDYHAGAPLNLTLKPLEQHSRVDVLTMEYDSPIGGRVTGFLVQPRDAKRHAGIVFGHWGPGNATEFLLEAMRYAESGAVCILPSYPWTRPAPWYKAVSTPKTTPEQDRDILAQAAVDLRRAIDVLLARPDVDPKRIAYIGHSYGAQFGAILAAVDKRLATCILMAGVPSVSVIYLESNEPPIVELRNSIGVEKLKSSLAIPGELDAVRFVPHAAPVPLLFQFAKYEVNFNERHMKAYFDAASEPKKVLWYPTGHELNDPQALTDRMQWLESKIDLSPVTGRR